MADLERGRQSIEDLPLWELNETQNDLRQQRKRIAGLEQLVLQNRQNGYMLVPNGDEVARSTCKPQLELAQGAWMLTHHAPVATVR